MFPFGQKHKLETPNCMHFFKVELLADLSCCIVAKDVGLVHELCGSNDLSQVQIRKKVMVKALAAYPDVLSLQKSHKNHNFFGGMGNYFVQLLHLLTETKEHSCFTSENPLILIKKMHSHNLLLSPCVKMKY